MSKKKTTEQFIKEARQVHGNKYDYSKVEYVGNKELVTIICPIHGEVPQRPIDHLRGRGCKYCAKPVHDTKSFVEKARRIHDDKYDYSKTEYKGCREIVNIICKKHGEFEQIAYSHLHGNGCPKCKQSHMEAQIDLLLANNNINYKYNDKPKFLNGLEADFYLEDENIIIECQGTQHLIDDHFFEPLSVVIERDKRKNVLSSENDKKMIYIVSSEHKEILKNEQFNHMYDDALFIEDIIKDNNILLNKIIARLND